MVAYSFDRRFMNSIRLSLGIGQLSDFPPATRPKFYTLRNDRKNGHARQGDMLQLFYGQRTKACLLIGLARCTGSWPITVRLNNPTIVSPQYVLTKPEQLEAFAWGDGFDGWEAFKTYWQSERGVADEFIGRIILWGGD